MVGETATGTKVELPLEDYERDPQLSRVGKTDQGSCQTQTAGPERDLAAETNVDLLHELLGPPLGVIPWLGDIKETNEERTRLAKLFAERVALGRLSPA